VPFEVPGSWVWTNIEELFFVTKLAGFEYTDYLTKDTISSNNAVPIVRAQNVRMGYFIENTNEAISEVLSQQLERSALTKKCLLMTFIGAGIGDTCIFPALKRCHLAPNVAKIEPYYDEMDLRYALYYLMSDIGQLGVRGISKSTAQPSLSMATIRSLDVALPPLAEQERIVSEIQRWFVVIDQIEQEKVDLHAVIKQTKSKILDLAIHGKLVPQDPNDEPASELLKRINPKAELTCDNGQYGKIPSGWCMCKLEELCKIKGGKRIPRGMSFSNNKTPYVYLRVTDMKSNTIQLDDLKYIDQEVFEQIKNYTINSTDLYLTIAGTIGSVGIIPEVVNGMNLTENAAKLTSIACNKEYLLYALQSSIAQDHFTSRFHQVAQPKLSIETANKTPVPLPPLSEQHRIVAKIEELFNQLDQIQKSLEA